jgi:hypothetical protein
MSRLPFLLAAIMTASSALAAPPAAPQVTVGAANVKQLRFDFEIVPRSNYYELWFKANPNVPEVKFFESVPWRPTFTNNVSVHLLDWDLARYRVTACNPSGCASSAPISVSKLRFDAAGYFRSSTPRTGARLGQEVAASEDGATFAATAPNEPRTGGGTAPAVYVYSGAPGRWRQQAKLPVPSNPEGGLSLSADGNVLAVGGPHDAATGDDDHGAVWIFRRSGNTWTREATIKRPLTFDVSLGWHVELNEAGDMVMIEDNFDFALFYKRVDGAWVYSGYMPGAPGDVFDGVSCAYPTMSADGLIAARACFMGDISNDTRLRVYTYAVPAWKLRDEIVVGQNAANEWASPRAVSSDLSGDTLSFSYSLFTTGNVRATEIYRRGASGYQREAVLTPGSWHTESPQTPSAYGQGTLSRDGKFLAVADANDTGLGRGSLKPPLARGTQATGAVYVYERKASGWNLRRLVKPNNPAATSTLQGFGSSIAFGDGAKNLVIGEPTDRAAAGAAWLY